MKKLSIFSLLLAAAATLQAQTAVQPRTDQERIQQLETKLDALSRALEQERGGAASGSAAASGGGGEGLGVAASKIYGVSNGVSLGGYGEFLYQNFNRKLQDGEDVPVHDNFDTLRGVF